MVLVPLAADGRPPAPLETSCGLGGLNARLSPLNTLRTLPPLLWRNGSSLSCSPRARMNNSVLTRRRVPFRVRHHLSNPRKHPSLQMGRGRQGG